MLISVHKITSRYSAAFLHFVLSLFIFAIFIGILLLFWYPAPYFSASGGWQGLRLVALVDLVLGPCLTLIIYNTFKSRRELFIDFLIIAVIQVSALLWGISTVYKQRPVATVFWQGNFYTVPATALTTQGVDLAELNRFSTDRPVYVYAQPPMNEADAESMLQIVMEQRIPPHEQLVRYRPLAENMQEVRQANLNIQEITDANADMAGQLEAILRRSGTSRDDNLYVALMSRYRNIVLVFSAQDELLGMLTAPPIEGPT